MPMVVCALFSIFEKFKSPDYCYCILEMISQAERIVLLMQGFATMPFIFTASADGSKPVKCAHQVSFVLNVLLPLFFLRLPPSFYHGEMLTHFLYDLVVIACADNSEWEFQKYGHQNLHAVQHLYSVLSRYAGMLRKIWISCRFL